MDRSFCRQEYSKIQVRILLEIPVLGGGLKDNRNQGDTFDQMHRGQWKSTCKNVFAIQNACKVVNTLLSPSETSSMFTPKQETKCFCFNPEIHDSLILCLMAKNKN